MGCPQIHQVPKQTVLCLILFYKLHNCLYYGVVSFIDIRSREVQVLSMSLIVQSLTSVLQQTVPTFASAFTFLAMTGTGENLTVTQVGCYIVRWC